MFCVHLGGEPLIFAYRTSSGCVSLKQIGCGRWAQSIPERMIVSLTALGVERVP